MQKGISPPAHRTPPESPAAAARGKTAKAGPKAPLLLPPAHLSAAIEEEVEVSVKYAGYIERQQRQVAEFARMEERRLSADIDYEQILGLRLEARQKLNEIRPLNLGQASRISGVSPADIAALMVWLEK